MTDWQDVDPRIKARHTSDTAFFVVSGHALAPLGQGDMVLNEKELAVVIPVDGQTVYDVRDDRLVVLTGREVVELSPDGEHAKGRL